MNSSQALPNMRETTYRTHLEAYAERWSDMIVFRREDGILEMRFHTDGGPFLWGVEVHKNIIPLMNDIASDPDNECLIITGTGDSFLTSPDLVSWRRGGYGPDDPHFEADLTYDHWYLTQTRLPFAFLNLPIPIVAALNGPHRIHVEMTLCSDIVIAAETTIFQDVHLYEGVVAGDSCHVVWQTLLGVNRGRAFLLSGDVMDAQEALRLGVVYEVVPIEQIYDRAWEIARMMFMAQPRLTRRMSHSLLMQPWREAFEKRIYSGLAHEAVAGRDGRIANAFGAQE